MTTMTLPLSAVQSLASLAATIKLSKYDADMTPVLTFLQVTATENGGFSALATDRYRIGRVQWTPHEAVTPHAIPGSVLYVQGATLLQFAKLAKTAMLPGATVTLQQDDAVPTHAPGRTMHGPLTITGEGIVNTGPEMALNFPPVERLMYSDPAAEGSDVTAGVQLKAEFLAGMALMTGVEETATEGKRAPWGLVQREPEYAHSKRKAQPVTFYRSGRSHSRKGAWVLEYMVQPNMDLSAPKGARA